MMRWVATVLLSCLVIAGFLLLLGENPIVVAQSFTRSLFSSSYDFGVTLFYTTILTFSGLAVAIAFRAGLFNIGAEGQLTLGAFAAASIPHLAHHFFPGLGSHTVIFLSTMGAFLAGALWGAIAGLLKAYRGAHEVITTIMLNFIAAGGVSYLTLYVLKDPESQAPQTPLILEEHRLSAFTWFDQAPVTLALPLSLLCVVLFSFILRRTLWGFDLRAMAQNQAVARFAGISVPRLQWIAFAFAGGAAGWVGLAEVLGSSYQFRLGFSPQYGFMGIAVALLVKGRPLLIPFSAFLFAGLHKGSIDLAFESEKVTKELALVMQGLLVLVICCSPSLYDRASRFLKTRLRGKAVLQLDPKAKQQIKEQQAWN